MSTMILIRHSQASFFAADYDQLSPMGEEQSRLLGRYLGLQISRIDEVYTGPRSRQRRTAELVGETYRHTGHDWPVPVVMTGLDEYDLTGIVERLAPELADRDARFASLVDANLQSTQPRDRLRTFQAMFEYLLLYWQSEALQIANIESWPDFRKRVDQAIRQIQQSTPRSRRVAIVTSGGFIGTAVQSTLTAPDRSALELNWRVRNSSLTEFVFTPDRLTLDSFNTVPHLPDSTLWTYR